MRRSGKNGKVYSDLKKEKHLKLNIWLYSEKRVKPKTVMKYYAVNNFADKV